MESGESGKKERSTFFIPWSPLPSPMGRNTLKNFGDKACDTWSCRIQITDYSSLASGVPFPGQWVPPCQCLSPPLFASTARLWPGFPASGWVLQHCLVHSRKRKKAWYTPAFSSFNTTPQQEELHANQIILWIKTSNGLCFLLNSRDEQNQLRLHFGDFCICLSNLNAV